jgi:filamentous hemagglutinin
LAPKFGQMLENYMANTGGLSYAMEPGAVWADGANTAEIATDEDGIRMVGGRNPINSGYAGQTYPLENLPVDLQVKYPNSVQFTSAGFPDFSPYSQAEVQLDGLTGNYANDSAMANEAVDLDATPDGYVWHHVEDGQTMQLIPQDLHNAVRHTGGSAVIRYGD